MVIYQKFKLILLCFVVLFLLVTPVCAEIISQIKLEGNKRVGSDYILSVIGSKQNEQYSENILADDIRKLYNTDLFTNINTSFQSGVLSIIVVENPLIYSVNLIGNKNIKADVINKELVSKNKTTFSVSKADVDVQRIVALYHQSGYMGASVSYTTEEKDQNRIILNINIIEGKKTTINQVDFYGNIHFSNKDLSGVILTKAHKWYRLFNAGDVYDKNRILYDGELLRQFYLENGYPHFNLLSTTTEFIPWDSSFKVLYIIDEGERYKFGDVSFDIRNSEFKKFEPQLKDLVQIDTKKWFKGSVINKYVSQIYDLLKTEGYQFMSVNPEYSYNDVLKTVDIKFVVSDQKRVFVNRIDIFGNTKTRDYVVRRELNFNEGDPYSQEDSDESTRSLYKTGYFSSVNISTQPSSNPDETNVAVNLDETSTASITAGGGYSTLEKVQLNFSLNEANFLGRGLQAGFGVDLSQVSNSYNISLANPYFLDKDLYLGFSLYKRDVGNSLLSSTSITNDTLLYHKKEQGGSITLGYSLTDNIRHTISYNLFTRNVSNVKDGAGLSIDQLKGKSLVSTIENTFSYDGTNNSYYPTEGMTLSLQEEFAGLGGDVKYLKSTFTAMHYKELFIDDLVLSSLFSIGNVTGLGGQDVLIVDKYMLGGATLRGFAINLTSGGLGPLDSSSLESIGGKNMVRSSFEIDYPIPGVQNYGLIGHVFNDWGTITDFSNNAQEIDSKKLRSSVGFGVSWKSPAGVITIDLAKPIMKDKYDQEEMIFFNFGTRF